MQPQPEYVGRTIDGRYVVESLLGKGGMGVVLRVRHKYTGLHAALKLLHPHLRMHGDLAQRFLAEARAPAAIGHPGIVTVVDAGFSPEGELYLVMELLQGQTLAAAMKPQPMPFAAIRRVGLEMLAALGAAHAAGFIHRDLKPENVFLVDPAGSVKLLDFGIAKVLDEGLGARGETQTGMVMGTVAYMSPEQLRDSRNVDPRTDLWAAGVMIYEMATGRLPYASETLGNLLLAMMSQPPRALAESLAEVPPPLELFLRRALAVDVHQRFASAAEMAAVLASMHVMGLRRREAGPRAAPAAAAAAAAAVAVAAPGAAAAAAAAAAPVAAAAPAPAYVPPAASFAQPPSAIQPVSSVAAAPPPAARSRTATYVALGAILAALGLAVALVLVLRSGGGATVATSVAPDAASAPAPTSPPDASPPQPLSLPDAAPAKPSPRAAAPTKRDICRAACATSARKCGVLYSTAPGVPSCLDTCVDYPAAAIECLADAEDDCDEIGACGFEAVCGKPPDGHATCAATSVCMLGCGNDPACTCRCAHAMDVDKTNLFLRFASCALARCSQDCQVNVNLCRACVTSHCAAAATACMAQ
jgi:hypothetical protein